MISGQIVWQPVTSIREQNMGYLLSWKFSWISLLCECAWWPEQSTTCPASGCHNPRCGEWTEMSCQRPAPSISCTGGLHPWPGRHGLSSLPVEDKSVTTWWWWRVGDYSFAEIPHCNITQRSSAVCVSWLRPGGGATWQNICKSAVMQAAGAVTGDTLTHSSHTEALVQEILSEQHKCWAAQSGFSNAHFLPPGLYWD